MSKTKVLWIYGIYAALAIGCVLCAGCKAAAEDTEAESQTPPGSEKDSDEDYGFDDNYNFNSSSPSFYVSSSGNDNDHDGKTEDAPYRTLAKAYGAALADTNRKRIVILSDLSETGLVTLDPTNKTKNGDDLILIEGKIIKLKIERSEGNNDSVLKIAGGAKIIFKNIMINGKKNETVYHRAITVEGTIQNKTEVTLGDRAVVTGKVNENTRGGGIQILSDAKLTMIAGSVIKNSFAKDGGGIMMNGGTFIMTGGEIRNNASKADGGGVYLRGDDAAGQNNTFNMTGGVISANTSGDGGGVAFIRGSFTMGGGVIGGNKATGNGGGVYIIKAGNTYASTTFTMTSGVIYGNTEATEALRNTSDKPGEYGAALYKGESVIVNPSDLVTTSGTIDKR